MVSKYDVVECQQCHIKIPYTDNEIKNKEGLIIGFLCDNCGKKFIRGEEGWNI